jgi:hypothetical protein
MSSDTIIKIKILKDSMRCFIFGLLGLLPFIGLPFGLAALWISGSIRNKEKHHWNPARTYRVWGVTCAAISSVFWSGILICIIGHFFMHGRND